MNKVLVDFCDLCVAFEYGSNLHAKGFMFMECSENLSIGNISRDQTLNAELEQMQKLKCRKGCYQLWIARTGCYLLIPCSLGGLHS